MNVFAKFDGIPSVILEVIKETKRYGHTVIGRSVGRSDNVKGIPSHKHSLRGYNDMISITYDQYQPLLYTKL